MLENFNKELKKIKENIKEIAKGLYKANEIILEAVKSCDDKNFEDAKSYVQNVTKKSDKIDNKIVKLLALYTPEARDLREVVAYLKISNELLRASASTRSFIRRFMDVCSSVDIKIINEYALPLQSSTVKALKLMLDMLDKECIDELQDIYNEILIEENKTDDLYEILEKYILKNTTIQSNFEDIHKMLKAFRKSEKIADRSISIANLLVYIKVGGNIGSV